jgi:hypothetical protein
MAGFCQLGHTTASRLLARAEGIVSRRRGSAIPLRVLRFLANDQEPGLYAPMIIAPWWDWRGLLPSLGVGLTLSAATLLAAWLIGRVSLFTPAK